MNWWKLIVLEHVRDEIAAGCTSAGIDATWGRVLFCREGLLMGLPGFLYFLMNQLAFIGLENVEASTYALVSQLKILTTAVFMRLLVGKRLQWFQWRALLLLIIGVFSYKQQPPSLRDLLLSMWLVSTCLWSTFSLWMEAGQKNSAALE